MTSQSGVANERLLRSRLLASETRRHNRLAMQGYYRWSKIRINPYDELYVVYNIEMHVVFA